MNHGRRDGWKAALSLAFWLCAIPASAEDMPPGIFSDWAFYNDAAWKCLNRGDYVLAEERFDLAIKAVRPYFPDSRRLLARSYCDLARTLYHEERYAEAEPLAKWALAVREADSKTTPEVLFQCTYTLGVIHAAQGHYRDAEALLKRCSPFSKSSSAKTTSTWR